MSFTYPARRKSGSTTFQPRTRRFFHVRRTRLRTVGLILGVILLFVWLVRRSGRDAPYRAPVPSGDPRVVMVTVLDPWMTDFDYLDEIKNNREQYAARHGYKTFIVKANEYDTGNAAQSWSKVMAMRHALTKFPDCAYLWFLDQDALIMSFSESLEEHLLSAQVLSDNMIVDKPIVPPNSIIKTFSHMEPADIELVVGQDSSGLMSQSLVLKNGEFAKFLLETWLNPLYRSYNFQRAERHALEHIVQWHPTILSKLALVPQRLLGSYATMGLGDGYDRGDFAVVLNECGGQGAAACSRLAAPYLQQLSTIPDY